MKDIINELSAGMRIVKEYVDSGKIPGACCGFVSDSGTYFDHYGYKSLIPVKSKNSISTIYDMASCTKVISTTTITLQAIENGLCSLRTPLSDILNDFPYRSVTIGNLLTHTSGICHDDKSYKNCNGKKEMWEFVINKPLEFEPGTSLVYSDFGYVVLGFALEKLLGPLDVYAKEHIFDPLGMKDTMYNPKKHMVENRCASTENTCDRGIICGDVHDGKAFRLGGVSGNAGLFSTVEDVSKFSEMLLNNGELGNKRILTQSTCKLLKKNYTAGLTSSRTLGWIKKDKNTAMGDYYSDDCLYHTGFTGTSIYIDYERNCAVILLSNRIHPSRDNQNIMDFRNKFLNEVLIAYDIKKGS